jgi:hypothetical protein
LNALAFALALALLAFVLGVGFFFSCAFNAATASAARFLLMGIAGAGRGFLTGFLAMVISSFF